MSGPDDFSLARDSLQAQEPAAGLRRFRRRGYQRFLAFMGDIDLAFVWKRRWFVITMIVGFALMAPPTPSGLTHEGQTVLVMSLMATMLFITEPIPLPTVPLLIIVGQVALLRVDPTKVAQSLMTDFGPVHHGFADAGGGHRAPAPRQAHRLVDRAHDGHQHLLDQPRHHHRLRHHRGIHRRAHRGRHDAPCRRHADHAYLERSEEGAQPCGRAAVLDLLRRSIAGVATPSGGARNAIIISYWKDFF